MALFVSKQNGNFNVSTSWSQCTNAPSPQTSSTNTITTGTGSSTFTAPNTTDGVVGVLFYLVSGAGNATNLVITLQENTIDTVAVATLTAANMRNNTWYYLKFPSTYTFTTTTAGAYRFKFTRSGTGTIQVSADGSSLPCAASVDTRTGTPTTGDTAYIISSDPSGATPITITASGTSNPTGLGSSVSAGLAINRANNAINIGVGGVLAADTTVTSSLTGMTGHLAVDALGTLQLGTSGSPVTTANPFTFSWAPVADASTFSFVFMAGCTKSFYGSGYTGNRVNFVSGLGTAASPLITDGDIGNVGDQVVVTAASNNATNYTEPELRFIITKNSTTSYVLSNTSGGTENALVNTHTGALVINMTGSITITTTTAFGQGMKDNITVAANSVMRYVRFEKIGSGQSNQPGFQIDLGGTPGSVDNCVFYNNVGPGVTMSSTSATTHSNLMFYGGPTLSTTQAVYASFIVQTSNKTFIDCSAVATQRSGFYLNSAFNNTFTRLVANGCNVAASTAANYAGVTLVSSFNNVFDTPRINACRTHGIVLQAGTDNTFTNGQIGTVGTNVIDIDIISSTYNKLVFSNCAFGSATLLNNYPSLLNGSLVAFHNLNQTTNNHRWYTRFGSAGSAGSGLSDTTVRTPGSLDVWIKPEDATTGFSWLFYLPTAAGTFRNFFGYFNKNASFGTSTAKVELFLPTNDPTSGTADASATLTNTTGSYLPISIGAQYNGTVDGLSAVKITGISSTAGATLYIDDLFNAGDGVTNSDKVTGLDTWDKGQPISIVAPQTTSAAAIWTYPTVGLTAAGTTGLALVNATGGSSSGLTLPEFIGLKK